VADDEAIQPTVVDLAALAAAGGRGPLWTHQSADLNVNLIALEAPRELAASVNAEVDVLLVGIAGAGTVEVAGCFIYLTCHRRRGGLWPSGVPRPGKALPEA
jgi:hypothetical protein